MNKGAGLNPTPCPAATGSRYQSTTPTSTLIFPARFEQAAMAGGGDWTKVFNRRSWKEEVKEDDRGLEGVWLAGKTETVRWCSPEKRRYALELGLIDHVCVQGLSRQEEGREETERSSRDGGRSCCRKCSSDDDRTSWQQRTACKASQVVEQLVSYGSNPSHPCNSLRSHFMEPGLSFR